MLTGLNGANEKKRPTEDALQIKLLSEIHYANSSLIIVAPFFARFMFAFRIILINLHIFSPKVTLIAFLEMLRLLRADIILSDIYTEFAQAKRFWLKL